MEAYIRLRSAFQRHSYWGELEKNCIHNSVKYKNMLGATCQMGKCRWHIFSCTVSDRCYIIIIIYNIYITPYNTIL